MTVPHRSHLIGLLVVLTCSAFLSEPAKAAACRQSGLRDFSVFTLGDMTAAQSDVQGSIAVGGNLKLNHYEIAGAPGACLAVAVAGSFSVSEAQIGARIEACSAHSSSVLRSALVKGELWTDASRLVLVNSTVHGALRLANHSSVQSVNSTVKATVRTQFVSSVDFTDLGQQLVGETERLAGLPANQVLSIDAESTYVIAAKEQTTVVDLTNFDLTQRALTITGAGAQKLVLQNSNRRVDLRSVQIHLVGFEPKNIDWVFPNAQVVTIAQTAQPVFGLPGYFFAPQASLEFEEGLVTGALYVKSWQQGAQTGKSSGQVNGINRAPSTPLN
jgi:choice-of-anchor A domain-containing protein